MAAGVVVAAGVAAASVYPTVSVLSPSGERESCLPGVPRLATAAAVPLPSRCTRAMTRVRGESWAEEAAPGAPWAGVCGGGGGGGIAPSRSPAATFSIARLVSLWTHGLSLPPGPRKGMWPPRRSSRAWSRRPLARCHEGQILLRWLSSRKKSRAVAPSKKDSNSAALSGQALRVCSL